LIDNVFLERALARLKAKHTKKSDAIAIFHEENGGYWDNPTTLGGVGNEQDNCNEFSLI
jgi:hypothetical protein